MKLTILIGLPASKKSTYALSHRDDKTVIVNRDTIRLSQYGVYWHKDMNENLITKFERQQMIAAFENGFDLISDNTNLNKTNVQRMVNIASQFGAEVEYVYFDVPPATCIEYDKNRDRRVGEKVITRMAKKAGIKSDGRIPRFDLYYHNIKPYKNDLEKYPAIVVDIDGTIALKSDRSPYDYSRVYEDGVQLNVATLLYTIEHYPINPPEIIFLSGRSEDCREETERWLDKKFYMGGRKLFMRPSHDPLTPDFIVKDRLFDEYVADNYNVIGVFDDRRQVVQMWRSKGLTCLDVAGNKF